MITITYADVVDAIVQRADIDAPSDDTFITESEMEAIVTAAVEALSSIIHEHDPELLTNTVSLITTPNVATLQVPTFAHAIQLVGWEQPDGVIPLRRASPEEWFAFATRPGGWQLAFTPYYRFIGGGVITTTPNTLEFYPKPTRVETVRVMTVSELQLTSTPGIDAINGSPNMREYLILHACARIMQSQEKDDSMFLRCLADAEQRLRSRGVRRDKNAIHTVRDVVGAEQLRRDKWWP